MTKSAKAKAKTSPHSKRAKAKASWGETMKKALAQKRPGGSGPDRPKPRDSGTFKVKKDSF
ncbi:MAG: hypothetical protein ACREV5_07445 [Steroidobacter sp.]